MVASIPAHLSSEVNIIMKLERLAYIGLWVEDPQAWLRFATDGLGLVDGGAGGDSLRLRMDDRSWRIALHPAPSNDLAYIGFEVDATESLEQLATTLRGRDIECRRMTPAQLQERHVQAGIAFKDPDGLDIEVVRGLAQAAQPFASKLVPKFVTNGQGLGHVVLSSPDPERTADFYKSLGFALSDTIEMDVGSGRTLKITFLHCNSRHHTLALARIPMQRRMDHLMVEVESVDDVIAAYNRMRHLNYPLRRHLGRHPNDRMLSFYVITPAGFDVEFGWDGRQIGEDWQAQTYDRISLWGHEAS